MTPSRDRRGRVARGRIAVAGTVRLEFPSRSSVKQSNGWHQAAADSRPARTLRARLLNSTRGTPILIRKRLREEFEITASLARSRAERHPAAFGDVKRGAMYTRLSRFGTAARRGSFDGMTSLSSIFFASQGAGRRYGQQGACIMYVLEPDHLEPRPGRTEQHPRVPTHQTQHPSDAGITQTFGAPYGQAGELPRNAH